MHEPWLPGLIVTALAVLVVWGVVRHVGRWVRRPALEALEALARGNYLTAAERLREFGQGKPFLRKLRMRARVEVGHALQLAGDYEASIREMEAIDLAAWPAPLTGAVHRFKASALLALGRVVQAEHEARLALQHGQRTSRPEEIAGAEIVLAAAALQRGHLTSALQHLRPFTASCTPLNAAGFGVMADVLRVRGDFDEARQSAQAILELASSLAAGPRYAMGAVRELRTLALYSLAATAVDCEAWADAEKHLSALQLCQPLPPRSAALANALLGIVYSAEPRHLPRDQYFDLAERVCAVISDDNRTLAFVTAQRGRAALYTHEHDLALTYLRRSLEQGVPEVVHPRVWYNIGLAHEALGDAQAARDAFERASTAGQPDHLHVKLARQKLEAGPPPGDADEQAEQPPASHSA